MSPAERERIRSHLQAEMRASKTSLLIRMAVIVPYNANEIETMRYELAREELDARIPARDSQ